MIERVVVVNGYGGQNKRDLAFASWLVGLHPTVAMISEAWGLEDALRRVLRIFNGKLTKGSAEVAIAMPLDRRITWASTKQLTRDLGTKFAPDRWYTRVREGDRVFYSVHANAVIQNHDGTWKHTQGAKVWETDGLPALEARIAKDVKKNRRIIVGGDFNAGGVRREITPSPAPMFRRLGLQFRVDRVMWIGYRGYALTKYEVLPIAPGADAHNVLLVELRPR